MSWRMRHLVRFGSTKLQKICEYSLFGLTAASKNEFILPFMFTYDLRNLGL